MFDARKLLDTILAAGAQASGQATHQNGAQAAGPGSTAGSAGGLGSILTGVLGQLGQGAQQAGTAAGGALDSVQGRLEGTQAGDVMAKARQLAAANPAVAGAIMGGLATLVLGSKSGRAVTGSAVKLGGLALIGGLAYKAFQNYQAGKPVLSAEPVALPAPAGSGFEAERATDETALLFVRAMIAAAAADGVIDAAERATIVGGMAQAGFDTEGSAWLEHQMANPASVDELVAAATTPEIAAQVYTAARLAIEPDTAAERDFLAGLAGELGLDAELAANIDMAAAGVKA